MTTYIQYEIARTGKLEQYYTLYREVRVFGEGYSFSSYGYVKNLSITEEGALSSFRSDYPDAHFTLIDSPKKDYADLEAFGLIWEKTPKGFITVPDRDFWALWRREKSLLKEIGFSVFKKDSGQFVLFFKFVDNNGLDKAFTKLASLRDNAVITGDFFGDVGEKITIEEATVTKATYCEGQYGTFCMLTLKKDDFTFFTKYTGKKFMFNDGDVIDFSATVKTHEVKDLQNVTTITRLNKVVFYAMT